MEPPPASLVFEFHIVYTAFHCNLTALGVLLGFSIRVFPQDSNYIVIFLVFNQDTNICYLCSLENSMEGVCGFNYPFIDNFDNAYKELRLSYQKNHMGLQFSQLFLPQIAFSPSDYFTVNHPISGAPPIGQTTVVIYAT